METRKDKYLALDYNSDEYKWLKYLKLIGVNFDYTIPILELPLLWKILGFKLEQGMLAADPYQDGNEWCYPMQLQVETLYWFGLKVNKWNYKECYGE